VHALKPVENLYLTETLQPGAYVVGVHNYSLRQLADNVIGSSAAHEYRTFDDFKKMDPGYQKMEKALLEQIAHAADPDGTPEKQAIMARVDAEMNSGSNMIQTKCNSGTLGSGVHYGVTLYNYPAHWEGDEKHPQTASIDELQNVFQTGFFATADFVFDPDANTTGYNGANVVADVNSEEGKLALGEKRAAHVALLKIVKDAESGKSKISEVIMLEGSTRPDLGDEGSGQSAMNAFRAQSMIQRNTLPSRVGPRGTTRQVLEPCPEPTLQQMPRQRPQTQIQQPFPEPGLQQMPASMAQMQTRQQLPQSSRQQMLGSMPQMRMQQPVPEPGLQQTAGSVPRTQMQQPLPQSGRQQMPGSMPQMRVQQPFPQPSLQQMPVTMYQMPTSQPLPQTLLQQQHV